MHRTPSKKSAPVTLAVFEKHTTKTDKIFAQIDRRFADIDKRFIEVDKKFAAVDRRFDRLELRMDRIDMAFESLAQLLHKEVLGLHQKMDAFLKRTEVNEREVLFLGHQHDDLAKYCTEKIHYPPYGRKL